MCLRLCLCVRQGRFQCEIRIILRALVLAVASNIQALL